VIESFKHKGLKKLFLDDDRQKIPAAHREKIARILARLNEAGTVQHMALGLPASFAKRGFGGVLGCVGFGKLADHFSI